MTWNFKTLPILLRGSKQVKPRLFKVHDHQEDHLLVEEAIPDATKNNVKLDRIDVRKRFLRHYHRERLAMASNLPMLKEWDPLPAKTEPLDDEVMSNWLNTQAVKSLAVSNGLILDFKRPVEIDMILLPNEVL